MCSAYLPESSRHICTKLIYIFISKIDHIAEQSLLLVWINYAVYEKLIDLRVAIVVYREIREDTAQLAPARDTEEQDGTLKKREGSSVAVATDTANRVERRIVRGPTIFIPASNEWVHQFSWHGAITERGGSKTGYPGDTKVAHAW